MLVAFLTRTRGFISRGTETKCNFQPHVALGYSSADIAQRFSELLADDAQVVGRFEVGNPVVEETDTVRLAKTIQFVEPDRPLAPPLSSLKKSSNPPGVYSSMMRAGTCFTLPVPSSDGIKSLCRKHLAVLRLPVPMRVVDSRQSPPALVAWLRPTY